MSLLLLFQPPYHEVLLGTAQQLLDQGNCEIAVVTAQMACEIYTEQVFVSIYRKKGITYLEPAIDDLIPSYNLANEKVRALYFAMTGDQIQEQLFWPSYKDLVAARNRIMHAGARATSVQAQAACEVAAKLIGHLKIVAGRN